MTFVFLMYLLIVGLWFAMSYLWLFIVSIYSSIFHKQKTK